MEGVELCRYLFLVSSDGEGNTGACSKHLFNHIDAECCGFHAEERYHQPILLHRVPVVPKDDG